MAEENKGSGFQDVERLSLADILQMYDEATQSPRETTILTPPQKKPDVEIITTSSPPPVEEPGVIDNIAESKTQIPEPVVPQEEEKSTSHEPVVSQPKEEIPSPDPVEPELEIEPQAPIIAPKTEELVFSINELEDRKMAFTENTDATSDTYLVPSLIVTTPIGQYDLITTEGVNTLNQEIRDALSELEHQFGRLQRSWTAKKQIKKTYTALEEAARHDASSDEIIKIGERVALLKETVRTETPTKEELSNLLMKLETTRSIFARYIDILWHS